VTNLSDDDPRTFVEHAYTTILNRNPSSEEIDLWCAELSSGRRSRGDVLEAFTSSPEAREKSAIELAVRQGVEQERWSIRGEARWPGCSERVVEIPWVLSRCRGARRLLDVGYANASPSYLAALTDSDAMRVGRIYGIDLVGRSVPGLRGAIGNVCVLPLRSRTFDVVTCISTLEHVGADNRRYGVRDDAGSGTAADALAEIARVLAPAGRLLVTIPFGAYENHGWFVQHSERTWLDLVGASDFAIDEHSAFRHTDEGWVDVPHVDEMADLHYADGVPGATGVLCSVLSCRNR
jgi:SAM-dependent methyltransferase